jgi:PAS domain S-box-containing protein
MEMARKSSDKELRGRLKVLEQEALENRRERQALQATLDRYRLISEGTADLVAVTTFSLRPTYTYLSPSRKSVLGYEPDELLGKSAFRLIHPDDREKLRPLLKRYVAVKARNASNKKNLDVSETIEFRFRHKSDGWRYLQSTGNVIGNELLFISRDITDQRIAQEALQKSEQRHRTLVENAPIGIYYSDLLGNFLYGNKRAEEIVGYKREELIDKNFLKLKLLGPADIGRASKLLALNALGRATGPEEFVLNRKDGSKATVEINTVVTTIEGKTVVLGMVQDITDRKRLEKQLLWSQKMETVGRLAGGVAHEFNNLLAVIMMNAELAMTKLSQDNQVCSHLEAIVRSSDFGSKVVGELLTFSTPQFIKPHIMNLNDVLLDIREMLRVLIGETIELVTIPGNGLGLIQMDRSQLEQVLLNLVVNARDAMPHGGRMTVTTTNAAVSEGYPGQNADLAPGEYVMVAVRDTGVGMTEEIKARLFEPFFTTKEVGKGTGLGLATCYGIIKQSGGGISIESESGKGTTFRIYLLRVDQKPKMRSEPDEMGYLPQGTETVLVVEDNPSVRDVIACTLRELGYTVLDAPTGEEGLHAAREEGRRTIDLLLTDVVLPQMGGIELTENVRTDHPNIKVILVSGYQGKALAHQDSLGSGVAFLQKPFSPATLATRVREMLDQ